LPALRHRLLFIHRPPQTVQAIAPDLLLCVLVQAGSVNSTDEYAGGSSGVGKAVPLRVSGQRFQLPGGQGTLYQQIGGHFINAGTQRVGDTDQTRFRRHVSSPRLIGPCVPNRGPEGPLIGMIEFVASRARTP
jgi:hypothetical protein